MPETAFARPRRQRIEALPRWAKVVFVSLVVALAVGLLLPSGMSALGRWLVVADPIDYAPAVVVLGGHMPFRAMEAASIYRQGWAPEVWLTRRTDAAIETALARLGITAIGEEEYSRTVLVRSGVPVSVIRLLEGGVVNTVDEVQVIARELKRAGGERVIIVTSKPHTRRVRATWQAIVGHVPRAIVRYASEDDYDPEQWWRHSRDAQAVSHEIFGLMNVWAGFPVQPDRR
jgi:uncharacterized SAM-binding protein YcdF (DUF218 family)